MQFRKGGHHEVQNLFFIVTCYCCTFVLGVEAQQNKMQQQQKANQPQSAVSLDGKWTGKTGQDKMITFTVLNDRITEFSAEGRFEGYGCSTTSSTTTTINQPIVNKSFSFGVRGGPGGISLSISGTFTSSTEAQGTVFMQLHPIPGPPPGVPGHIPSCGGTMETTWKATKGAILVDTSFTTGGPAPAPSLSRDSSMSRSVTADDFFIWMIGEWEGMTTSFMTKAQDWQKIESGLDNRSVIIHSTSKLIEMDPVVKKSMSKEDIDKMMSMVYKGRGTMIIDPKTSEFAANWFDSTGTYKGTGRREGNVVITTWESPL
jgi:NifU-like protein involved in Fe-S cluster formation